MQMQKRIDFDNDIRFSIQTVANICGIQTVKPIGNDKVLAKCPFCNDKSGHLYLTIKESKGYNNVFKCVKCGESGSAITLYSKIKGVSTKQAFKELAGQNEYSPNIKRAREIIKSADKMLPCSNTKHKKYLNIVYRLFLNKLKLNSIHYKNLRDRGLSDGYIKKGMYRSVNVDYNTRISICRELMSKGCDLEGVPGFYLDDYNNWNFVSMNGFLIPIVDIEGDIVSLQIRRDDTCNGKKKRYTYFSSVNCNKGSKAIAGVHYIKGNAHPDRIYITEGPLKANIANYYSDNSYLAMPGVNVSQNEVIADIKTLGVKISIVTFDMDIYSKEEVKKALISLYEKMLANNITSMQKCWIQEYTEKGIKGIDDYYLYCFQNNIAIN